MPLWTPRNTYQYRISNMVNQRPVAAWGTSIPSASAGNTYGSWTEIIANTVIVHDLHRVSIMICNTASAGVSVPSVIDIGIDPTGGTSYEVLIPKLSSHGASTLTEGGILYNFPLLVPAGASVAARLMMLNTSAQTARVWFQGWGRPSHPELSLYGTVVHAMGNDGNTLGTAVTAGTTSDGTYTLIKETTNTDYFWTQFGFNLSTADTGWASLVYHCDVAHGNSTVQKADLITGTVATTTSEQQTTSSPYFCWTNIPAGSNVYARLQVSGTADTGTAVTVYGVAY